MPTTELKPYRWVILITLSLCSLMTGFAAFIFMARSLDIQEIFHLNQAQIALISSIGPLISGIGGLVLGPLFDKGKVKVLSSVFLLLAFAVMVVRIFAGSFPVLLLISILAGIFALPTSLLLPKLFNFYFPPQEMGIAMGVFISSIGLGQALTFAVGNLFATTKAAFVAIAIAYALVFLLWVVFIKIPADAAAPFPPPGGAPDGAKPKSGFGAVIKSRNLWVSAICLGLCMGAGMLVNVYLVESMVAVKGVTPVAAGFMGTTMFVCSIFGGLIFGLLLKKIGKLNSTACVLAVVAGLAFLAVWFAPFSAVTYVFFGLAGLFSYGAQSIAQTRLPLLPMTGDYTPANLAAATGLSGLIMAALMIGVSTAISAIAGTNYNLVFIIAALVFAVAGLLGFTVPELGAKGKLAQSAPAPAFPPVS